MPSVLLDLIRTAVLAFLRELAAYVLASLKDFPFRTAP